MFRLLLLSAVLLPACAVTSAPIPVRGDLDPLVGEWSGSYSSPTTGRQGAEDSTFTTFSGTIENDVLEGNFTSYLEPSGRRVSGTWYVRRTRKTPVPR
jgi:hypothetical protein